MAAPRVGGRRYTTLKIDPFVGLFVAIVGAMAAMLIPVFLLLRADIARVETGLRTEIAGMRGELATANERMVRVEGAGALRRLFPERLAQAPGSEAGAGG